MGTIFRVPLDIRPIFDWFSNFAPNTQSRNTKNINQKSQPKNLTHNTKNTTNTNRKPNL